MAQDVATFLAWAAESEMEALKAMGWRVLSLMVVLTGFLGVLMVQTWKDLGQPGPKDG